MNPIRLYPWFSIIFVIIVAAEIMGLSGQPQIRLASKGMIMASLISIYILSAKRQDEIMLLGMIFALLGDAFLLFNGDTFFMIGLSCFLIMQVCYAFVFWKKRRIPRTRDKIIVGLIAVLPLLVIGLGWSHFAGLLIPVVLYTISITVMLTMSYLRHPRLLGYGQVLIGSILFVISDLALAVGKFMATFQYQGYLVMIAYILAQYLIVTGLLIDEQPRKTQPQEQKGTFGRHKSASTK